MIKNNYIFLYIAKVSNGVNKKSSNDLYDTKCVNCNKICPTGHIS